MTTQKYGDVVPSQRESIHEGDQVSCQDLVGETFIILKALIDSDNQGQWADIRVEHDGKKKTFITASGPLMQGIEKIVKDKLLEKGGIEATLLAKKSNTTGRMYYVFE